MLGDLASDGEVSGLSPLTDVPLECRRLQNEKSPPLDLVLVVGSASVVGCFSSILQPNGTGSSSTTSFLSLIAVSHAVEPFDARYCDIGLLFASGTFFVNRTAVAMLLAIDVFENCMGGCNVKSGIIDWTRTSLGRSDKWV